MTIDDAVRSAANALADLANRRATLSNNAKTHQEWADKCDLCKTGVANAEASYNAAVAQLGEVIAKSNPGRP